MDGKDRQQLRVEKEAIIRRMMSEGASVKEMAKATGYKKSTVGGVIAKIKTEMAQEEHLTFAKHPKPNMPIVEFEGKKYRDVTDVFLSSEWEGSEEYESERSIESLWDER
jgi:hypothetical protein